jgi:hypothetical protein
VGRVLCFRRDDGWVGDDLARGRGGERRIEAPERRLDGRRLVRIEPPEGEPQVGECRLRSIEERLRFLDLEGQKDLAVFHTPPVLDRNERQVAEKLPRPARLIRF